MNISDRIAALALAALVFAATPAGAVDRSAVTMPVPGQPYFVQLAPLFVPVIGTSDDITHQVSVAVAVEIADGAQAKKAEEKGPELGNAFLDDIYGYVQQRGGIGDAQGEIALKQRLKETATRVLAPIAVKEVELEAFFEQRQ
jgi:flagellar basal body-associated protein FliL